MTKLLTSSEFDLEGAKFKGIQGYAEAELADAPKGGTYKVVIHAFTHPGGKMTGRMELAKSGADTSSNGDVTAFICRACKKVVDPYFVSSNQFACPTCGASGDASTGLRVDVQFTHMRMDVLAGGVEYYWRAANGNASIYLLRYKTQVARALSEAAKEHKLAEVERLRKELMAGLEPVLYPLASIMKDNLSGEDMRARFRSFLQA